MDVQSQFQKLLEAESHSGDCEWYYQIPTSFTHSIVDEAFFDYTKVLSPAALDLEIRSLITLDSLRSFMNALCQRLKSRKDFEAVQAMQIVFLRTHAEVLIENEEVRSTMEKLLEIQEQESERVLELIASSLGTLGFVQRT